MKRGCAGICALLSLCCLEGSTSRKVMCESILCTAFQAGKNSDGFQSEGILSFVEYAPRLLIVLPSRQFFTVKKLSPSSVDSPNQTRCTFASSPTFHRLCTDFGTEDQRRKKGRTTAEKSFTFSRLQEKVEFFL